MKVFIDSEYKCHISNPEGDYQEKEIALFDGKCAEYIEGYSCTPYDGGEMITPWKPFDELDAAQREYERQILAEYEALIDELYAEVTGE
jgi:hypothetical protein